LKHREVISFTISQSLTEPLHAGGLWFYFFDIAFSRFENIYYASFSRDVEIEADKTGIQIAAKACYETRGAAKVFLKFSEYHGKESTDWSWADSHPSDASREAYLREESEVHNPEKHGAQCHQMSQYLQIFKKAAASGHPHLSDSEPHETKEGEEGGAH
jgi:predicted Zn-dependent protease